MGGFKELKQAVDARIDSVRNGSDSDFKYLLILCLFEIAGNLDTIAVEARKHNDPFKNYLPGPGSEYDAKPRKKE